jgi:hypothetical protein
MRSRSTPLFVCAIVTLLAPRVVCAQTQPASPPPSSSTDPAPPEVRRPFRGLFGGPADPRSKQSLELTASAFGAYDTNVFAATTSQPVAPGAPQHPGWYTSANAGLSYARTGDRFTVNVDGDSALYRYLNPEHLSYMYRAGGGVSTRIGPRTHVAIAGDFSYAPQYRLGLFFNPSTLTGDANSFSSVVPDYDLFKLTSYRSSGEASVQQELGRRASLTGFYSVADVNYTNSGNDYRYEAAGIHFSDRLTQHLGYHLGYSYNTAHYTVIGGVEPRRINNIDAGVDYGRALSFSRRTTLTFSTGSALVSGGQLATSDSRSFQYRITGTAMLRHEIGRTWTTALGYRRGVDWREGFVDPFLSDAVTGTFGGLISRRLQFNSGADYAFGNVGFGSSNNGYHSASAKAGLQLAMSRTLAVFARYVYYQYHFGSGVRLDPRLTPDFGRQGVSVGVEASVPIIR